MTGSFLIVRTYIGSSRSQVRAHSSLDVWPTGKYVRLEYDAASLANRLAKIRMNETLSERQEQASQWRGVVYQNKWVLSQIDAKTSRFDICISCVFSSADKIFRYYTYL